MKKSTVQTAHIRLPDALKTRIAGASLASSLYAIPVTILLTGNLGAGKTTFLQGLAEKLGIADPLTSPTYALEQRYKTADGTNFLHLDLYRLNEKDALAIVDSTDDHTGIRCIEWADRLPKEFRVDHSIHIHLEEEDSGRLLSIDFDDMKLPDESVIHEWRKDVMLPPHIIGHCEKVAEVAGRLSDLFTEKCMIVRKDALIAAAKLHDLLRFFDFKGASPIGIKYPTELLRVWNKWKEKIHATGHEDACAMFLRENGFAELATIVETHGLAVEQKECKTTEQKLLFYADKRVILEKVTTVEERFEDFKKRYSNSKNTILQSEWFERTKKMEEMLFPEGAPDLDISN